MSAMLDDDLGKIFASSPGLLVHLGLIFALSTARWLQSKEGKEYCAADVGFPRPKGGWKIIRVITVLIVAKIEGTSILADVL